MTSVLWIYFTLIFAAHFKCSSSVLNYTSLGCWRDTINRAIPTMEGDPLFGTTLWYQRPNATQLCAQVALKHGFQVFAVQAGGWCASSATARQTYKLYGTSTACLGNGTGGGWANQVYELVPPPQQCTAPSIINYKSLGCWNDGIPSAIPSAESDPILGGSHYKTRQNAREMCGRIAAKYGYTVFAVQDGGKCSTSASARQTYNKYGANASCSDYGKGATSVNNVYELVPLPVTWHQYNGIEYAVSWNYSKTYNEAKSICSVCDATLALPRSVDVRALLLTLSLDQNLGYWIGLTKDATTNGSYLWQDGNPLLKSQENYAQGQPAPPTGITSFCMIADKTMKWKVGNCSSQRGYICQRPSANPGGIVSGQSKVGSREFLVAKKRITVLYDRCLTYKPVSVQANVTGMASLPDKFSVQLISSFTWGFEVEVVRTDQIYGWVQSTVYLNWTATFNSSTFDTNPCGFGVTCTNLIGGHVCDCGSGAVGSYCSSQTTVITGSTLVGSRTNAFGRKRVIVKFQRCHFQEPISVFAVVNGSSTLYETFTWKLVASYLWGFVADIIRTDAPSGWNQSTVYINWNARFDSNNSARNPCGIGRTCSVHAGGYTCTCNSSIVGSSSYTSSIGNMTSIYLSSGPATRNAKFVFDQCQAFRPNNVTASVLPTTAQTYTVAITRVYRWGFKFDITASSNFVNATTITLVWNADSECWSDVVVGSSSDTNVFCIKTTITTGNASYFFNKTKVGYTTMSMQFCPNGNAKASVACIQNKTNPNTGYFGSVQVINCSTTISSFAAQVKSSNITTKSLAQDVATVKLLTSNTTNTNHRDVGTAAQTLLTLSRANTANASVSVNTMYDVLVTTDQLTASLQSTNTSGSINQLTSTQTHVIVQAVQNFANRFVLPINTTTSLLKCKQITLQVSQLSNTTNQSISYTSTTIPVSSTTTNSSSVPQHAELTATVPSALLAEVSNTSPSTSPRVSIIHYTGSTLFPATDHASFVISVSIKGYQPSTMKNAIQFYFNNTGNHQRAVSMGKDTLKDNVTRTQCSVYDANANEWVPNGCYLTIRPTSNQCSCFKLASFSMIMSTRVLPSAYALVIVSAIGCSLSMLGLIITIVVYISINELRVRQPTKFLLNICFCLFLSNLIFIFGAGDSQNWTRCNISTALLHYFLLATWFWMSANAYNLCKALLSIFRISDSSTTVPAVICYGLPFVIVILNSMIAIFYVDKKNYYPDNIFFESAYRARNMCWLHLNSLNFGFLLPVGILLLFNIACFAIVTYKFSCHKSKIQSNLQERSGAQEFLISMTMCCMMGLTWIFGFFMLLAQDVVYQSVMAWLFTIFNSTQGIFIFLVQCVRPAKVHHMVSNYLTSTTCCKQRSEVTGSVSTKQSRLTVG